MKARKGIASLICIALTACSPDGTEYHTGTFGDVPENFGDINSPFDDYNSTSPISGNTSPLCFSSNRNSNGTEFDIVYKLLDIFVDHRSGQLTIQENNRTNSGPYIDNVNIKNALSKLNTASDEMGPYLIAKGLKATSATSPNLAYQSYIFLYSSNEDGNQDIKLLQNLNAEEYTLPKPVPFLNSAKEDSYPSVTQDSSAVYFCSDRENNFDIYRAPLNNKIDLIVSLEATLSQAPVKDTVLSSDADDKCPFVYNNLMVFTSNRPGGFGGYDLYYSLFVAGQWSAPVNFGDKINTQYDEYRPIVKLMEEFTNDFMIFSSNRPEGKGGFDLYYVGIEKMIVP